MLSKTEICDNFYQAVPVYICTVGTVIVKFLQKIYKRYLGIHLQYIVRSSFTLMHRNSKLAGHAEHGTLDFFLAHFYVTYLKNNLTENRAAPSSYSKAPVFELS